MLCIELHSHTLTCRDCEPVTASSVDSDSAIDVLHTSLQMSAELSPVRTPEGYARPYLATDAPYARKGN